MSVKLNLSHHTHDFQREFLNIKKLIIFNNPNTAIEVIVDDVKFNILNSKTFECNGLCFSMTIDVKQVEDVIIEYWK